MHPLHNLAVVAYDPTLDRQDAGEDRRELAPRPLRRARPCAVVGLGADSELRTRSTQIAGIDPLVLPLSRTMRFRDSNLEVHRSS